MYPSLVLDMRNRACLHVSGGRDKEREEEAGGEWEREGAKEQPVDQKPLPNAAG